MATTFLGVNLQQVSTGIARALNFWGGSMRSILPKGMQKRLTVGDEQIIVYPNGEEIRVLQNVHGQLTELITTPQAGELIDESMIKLVKKKLTRDSDLLLMVPDEVVLSKAIDFPAAVGDNLRQALLYDMDKHTPFPKDEVLFDAQVIQRYAAKLQAQLYILHRSQVSDVLTAFQRSKVRFDRVCSENATNINLLPETLRRKRAIIPYKRNWLLAFLLLGVIALGFAIPLYFKRDAAIKLDAKMAQLSQQAMGEGELWERRDAGEKVVLDFIDAYPMPFSQIYEELSKILPDDTWVTALDFRGGQIIIRGEGSDATTLIKTINAHPLFKSARFASPIVKSQSNKAKDAYHITFEALATTSGAQVQ